MVGPPDTQMTKLREDRDQVVRAVGLHDAGFGMKFYLTEWLALRLDTRDLVHSQQRVQLGVDKAAPVGFAQIRLRFDVETDAAQDKLDQLLKLTERYCVVYQTLKSGPPIDVKLARG